MQPSLSLRVSQHLALTPQLQQSIRLLQLSTLEMAQEVEQMLGDNPFLEREDDEGPLPEAPPEPPRASTAANEADDAPVSGASDALPVSAEGQNDDYIPSDWEGDGAVAAAHSDGEWGGESAPRTRSQDDDGPDVFERARSHESLTAHLHRQALGLRLQEADRAALYFLIESLSDDGYLEEPLQTLAAALEPDPESDAFAELLHHLTVALHLLQSLEPTGVGARTLAECLQLQLQHLRAHAPDLHDPQLLETAASICAQPMELLARRDIKRLVQITGATDEQVRAAMTLITRLEPKPGRKFVDVERNVIVPDVIVQKIGSGANVRFRVQLNSDVMPRLRVHDIYASALKSHKGEGSAALQQRLQEARWFIKNIQQRFDTILRVSNAIVERQKSFFVHGELAMRPLVLREIADELGLHESTISRVTTAKYMSTPYGTFELKYFFGSALGTETGGNASSTAVRALIKQFVASESPKKPLSDNQISEMLKEQGIECARRTVAKYREALRIAPANLRKAL